MDYNIHSDYDMNSLGLLTTTAMENKMYFPGTSQEYLCTKYKAPYFKIRLKNLSV